MARKGIALAAIMIMALLAASQPASAGVGGCKPVPGVGGCGGWFLTAQDTGTRTPSVLDYSRGAVPVQVFAFLKAMLAERTATQDDGGLVAAPEDLTTAGVGGCFPRPGVGGCGCYGGFC